ncbi:MAG: hypothetical protein M3M96_04950 [Candidatus Eremiobacteraeota bacterium]|nr:hypothetical protein [Candidatus Eremiobacteraeota bacterium]
MPTFTLRYRTGPNEDAVAAVEAAVARCGGRVSWQRNAGGFPSYALVEGASEECAPQLRDAGNMVLDSPVIAIAVSPHAAEAMPFLEHALRGAGAPAIVSCCERFGDALLLEWNLDRAGAATVMALVDVELARVKCARTTRVLAPMPLAWWSRIAAEGLQSPEIAPDRVLEALLEQQGVVD